MSHPIDQLAGGNILRAAQGQNLLDDAILYGNAQQIRRPAGDMQRQKWALHLALQQRRADMPMLMRQRIKGGSRRFHRGLAKALGNSKDGHIRAFHRPGTRAGRNSPKAGKTFWKNLRKVFDMRKHHLRLP